MINARHRPRRAAISLLNLCFNLFRAILAALTLCLESLKGAK
jgi:hypothetical protein